MREFHTTFSYSPAHGLGPKAGVTRRDPSCIIKADDLYFVWYSKALGEASGYDATVWYATSPDGTTWTERGEAVARGDEGEWDEHSVFTPGILVVEDQYYLFHTGVPEPFTNDDGGPKGTPTAIGLAIADSPEGPWTKFADDPVLRPGSVGQFDSHRVDDSSLLVRDGKCWLYYKGRELGLSPAETKMGVAIADSPTGPYVKSDANPVISCGHEVLVWPHREGVATLVSQGPPSVWYSPDGISFSMMSEVADRPSAPGAYRPDAFTDPELGRGITWGLCQHSEQGVWPFLRRFDCDLRAEATGSDPARVV